MPRISTFPECFDECKQITIKGLKTLGFLRSNATVSGTYSWTLGGKPSGWINVTANLSAQYVELDYSYGDKPINYRVQLESIPKHFGGCDWYFICPATQMRCKTLYLLSDMFLSRHAYPSAMYSSQTESKNMRGMLQAYRCLDLQRVYLSTPYARTMYNGMLTKRFQRILDKEGRFDPNAFRRLLKQ